MFFNEEMETAQKIILFIFLLQGVCCRDFNISLPEKIEALTGSCVTINCRFDINNTYDSYLTDSAGGVWLKDGHETSNIVFNSSKSSNIINGKIIGKLKDKNCTTIFYEVSSNHLFYFRIEGNGGLKWTYAQKSVLINMNESPPKPTVKMFKEQMEVQDQEEVLEGSSVSLYCSVKTLCSSSPPTLTWSSTYRLPLSGSSRLQEQQKQTEIISDLNFTATHLQHGVTFTCTVTYQLKHKNSTAQRNITLRVQYAPKNTSVSVFPSASVLEGRSVTLTCSSDANPAVFNYTWYRETGGQLKQLQTGHNLTFNVTERTHTGRYYCRATNQHGTQNTSVLLNIQYAPRNTSTSVIPSSSVLEGNPVTLTCSSDANPAVLNYTWYRKTGGQFQLLKTGYNLTFSVTYPTDSGRYYCAAQNRHGQQNSSVLLDIQYAPRVSLSSCNTTDVTVYSCEVDGNPSPTVEWHLSGRAVTNSTNTSISEERLSSTGLRSFITLHQSLTHTHTLQCVSTNNHGTASVEFQLVPFSQETTGVYLSFVLIGAAVGASVIMILYVIKRLCERRENSRSSKTRQQDITGLNLADKDVLQENEEPAYVNKVMLSPADATTLNYPESLHYSSIDFTNTKTVSGEIRGVSSLNAVYAVVQHYSRQGEAKSSLGGIDSQPNISTDGKEPQRDQTIADSVAREHQFGMSTDIATKQALCKETEVGEGSGLYSQLKHCHPKS